MQPFFEKKNEGKGMIFCQIDRNDQELTRPSLGKLWNRSGNSK